MMYLADAYKFIPYKKNEADEYFRRAAYLAREEINNNNGIAMAYQYLARSLAYFGDINGAKEMMIAADRLDSVSAESCYSHLRISVVEGDEVGIRKYASCLLKTEYSTKFILTDPDFSILREDRFKNLFSVKH